jgi:hypothetical protein
VGDVGVAEPPLDHVQRDAFAGELDRVGVAQLVRRAPVSDTGLDGERRVFAADGGA